MQRGGNVNQFLGKSCVLENKVKAISVFDGSGNHGFECDHLGKCKERKEKGNQCGIPLLKGWEEKFRPWKVAQKVKSER